MLDTLRRLLGLPERKTVPANMNGRAVWLVYGGSLRRER